MRSAAVGSVFFSFLLFFNGTIPEATADDLDSSDVFITVREETNLYRVAPVHLSGKLSAGARLKLLVDQNGNRLDGKASQVEVLANSTDPGFAPTEQKGWIMGTNYQFKVERHVGDVVPVVASDDLKGTPDGAVVAKLSKGSLVDVLDPTSVMDRSADYHIYVRVSDPSRTDIGLAGGKKGWISENSLGLRRVRSLTVGTKSTNTRGILTRRSSGKKSSDVILIYRKSSLMIESEYTTAASNTITGSVGIGTKLRLLNDPAPGRQFHVEVIGDPDEPSRIGKRGWISAKANDYQIIRNIGDELTVARPVYLRPTRPNGSAGGQVFRGNIVRVLSDKTEIDNDSYAYTFVKVIDTKTDQKTWGENPAERGETGWVREADLKLRPVQSLLAPPPSNLTDSPKYLRRFDPLGVRFNSFQSLLDKRHKSFEFRFDFIIGGGRIPWGDSHHEANNAHLIEISKYHHDPEFRIDDQANILFRNRPYNLDFYFVRDGKREECHPEEKTRLEKYLVSMMALNSQMPEREELSQLRGGPITWKPTDADGEMLEPSDSRFPEATGAISAILFGIREGVLDLTLVGEDKFKLQSGDTYGIVFQYTGRDGQPASWDVWTNNDYQEIHKRWMRTLERVYHVLPLTETIRQKCTSLTQPPLPERPH